MAAQHTPGPWEIDGDALLVSEAPALVIANHVQVIAEVFATTDTSEPECAANARLIAAAPKMAEVLLNLNIHARPCNWDDEDQPGEAGFETANAWRALDALLAKLDGQS